MLALLFFFGTAAPILAQRDALVPAAMQRTALDAAQSTALARLDAQPTTARVSFVRIRLDALEAKASTRFDLGRETIVLPEVSLTRRAPAD
ncbi:MAG: hypothetical protein AAFU38_11545, partial [Bacteroidota bacterium]